jgi:hypothetical protein
MRDWRELLPLAGGIAAAAALLLVPPAWRLQVVITLIALAASVTILRRRPR